MLHRILVVDDDPDYSKTIPHCLAESKYDVVVVSSANSAREQILLNLPDLLVIRLPLPEAFTLLARLRDEPGVLKIPTITILRSWTDEDTIKKGWTLGVDAFLSMAFNCLELRLYIERIFRSIDETVSHRR